MTPLETRSNVILTSVHCRGVKVINLRILVEGVLRGSTHVDALFWYSIGAWENALDSPAGSAAWSLYRLLQCAQAGGPKREGYS